MIYGREEQKTAIRSQVSALREAAAMIPKVKAVVRRFDGKVYNCKLDNAIKELNETSENVRLYSGVRYGDWYYIDSYRKGGGSRYDVSILCGYAPKKERIPDGKMFLFDENKRIRADLFCASLDRKYEEIMKKASALSRAADELDTFCEQVASLTKTLGALKNTVPYEVLDICGLNR